MVFKIFLGAFPIVNNIVDAIPLLYSIMNPCLFKFFVRFKFNAMKYLKTFISEKWLSIRFVRIQSEKLVQVCTYLPIQAHLWDK
jgi:hypothetical protein